MGRCSKGKMKTVIFIPTYWTRTKEEGVKWTDVPHDHPTPIDETGTLKRAVLSLDKLEDRDFTLVVMATASFEYLEKFAEMKAKKILKEFCPPDIPTYLFSHRHLELLKNHFKDNGGFEFLRLINIHGYSNLRNLSQIVTQLLDADLMVSIDDDEFITDPEFLKKAKENIGRKVNGVRVEGVTGYYVNPSGDYHIPSRDGKWRDYWNKDDAMNRAFDMFISRPPRLKLASFALGGCMVNSRKLIETNPFDPLIPRGEDVDYLINARIFGLNIFMDNQLKIGHDPPPKAQKLWMTFMWDAIRYFYEREKLRSQKMEVLKAEDLDPYPGEFLKDDLDEKVQKASKTLFEEYLVKGEVDSAESVLDIPRIARERTAFNPYTHLLELKETWERLSDFIRDSGLKEQKDLFLEV